MVAKDSAKITDEEKDDKEKPKKEDDDEDLDESVNDKKGPAKKEGSSSGSIKVAVPNKSLSSNKISTTKHSLLTFLPMNLFKQIKHVAVWYYLVVMILQILPWTTISNGFPTIALLLGFCIVFGTFKDLAEDVSRHRLDSIENNFNTIILQGSNHIKSNWSDIYPGHIIKITKDEEVPADCIFLYSSNIQKEMCQIETKEIDFQTNLVSKTRVFFPEEIQEANPLDYLSYFVNSKINFDEPSADLYTFKGDLELVNNSVSIGMSNFILRKSILRNTDFIYAVVVYTGNNTRIMMNQLKKKEKYSDLKTKTDSLMMFYFLLSLILSALSALYFVVYIYIFETDLSVFIDFDSFHPFLVFFQKFINWVLIL